MPAGRASPPSSTPGAPRGPGPYRCTVAAGTCAVAGRWTSWRTGLGFGRLLGGIIRRERKGDGGDPVRGVTKRYPDGTEAVKQVDLDIGDGEFMILVGPSGCGKSTALRMIAGLEDITEGDLMIGGETVNDLPPKDRDIAMVFQNYALYPHMTVRENMGFALKLAKTDKAEIDSQGGGGRAHPRPRAAPRPQAGEPLRRPAPAGRHGPRDRARPEGVPDGRAAVEPRREAARADAHRGLADPAPARHDDGLRDPRPDRGDDARRPRGGHARRHHPAGRHAGEPLRPPGQPVRGRLHRLAVDELRARAGSRATRSSCRSATRRSATTSASGCRTRPEATRPART